MASSPQLVPSAPEPGACRLGSPRPGMPKSPRPGMQVTTSHLPGAPRTALAARWLMRLGIRKRGWTSDTVHGRSPAPAAVHKGFLRSWELNGFKARPCS